MGLCKVRLLSNNPLKIQALEEAGLKVVERVPIEVEATEPAGHYMRTKKEKLGHLLEFKI
jgi:3,4-dihydroxy 2-butanone 4-phosphate synthase/GTP cyclohydrolase II